MVDFQGCVLPGLEPRALCMLGACSITPVELACLPVVWSLSMEDSLFVMGSEVGKLSYIAGTLITVPV